MDAGISAATAQIAVHRLPDILVGRTRVVFEKSRGCHNLAGLTVAALGYSLGDPG